MYKRLTLLTTLILFSTLKDFSQQLDVSVFSGINNSDIHTIQTDNLWKAQKGPVAGIAVDFNFYKNFTLSSGLRYSVLYFRQLPYKGYQLYQNPIPLVNIYYSSNTSYTFSYYRIPLLLGWHTNTRLKFSFRAGACFSYLNDYDFQPNNYYAYPDVYSLSSSYLPLSSMLVPYYYPDSENHKFDFGSLYEAGFSYSIKNNISANLTATYYIGREEMITTGDARLGSSAVTGGITYSFFAKERGNEELTNAKTKMYVGYKLGGNFSWNIGETHSNSYTTNAGLTGGFDLGWQTGDHFAIQTGLWLQRKGYHYNDSSISFIRYRPSDGELYCIDSKIDLDYAVIPFLLNAGLGKSNRFYLLFGSYLGLKLNGRVTGKAWREVRTDYQYIIEEYQVNNDIEPLIKNSTIGLLVGGGYQLSIFEKYFLSLEINYTSDSKNIFVSGEEFQMEKFGEDDEIKLSALNFSIGIKVPLYQTLNENNK